MRLSTALAASLALHAVAASGLETLLAPAGNPPRAEGIDLTLHARLGPVLAQAAVPPRAATPPAPRLPALRYVDAAGLDVRPQIMVHVMPEYPPDLVSGARGRVVLELLIGADGLIDAVNVASARPAGVFDGAATQAFSRARFTPGMLKGKPVASRLLVEVTFGD